MSSHCSSIRSSYKHCTAKIRCRLRLVSKKRISSGRKRDWPSKSTALKRKLSPSFTPTAHLPSQLVHSSGVVRTLKQRSVSARRRSPCFIAWWSSSKLKQVLRSWHWAGWYSTSCFYPTLVPLQLQASRRRFAGRWLSKRLKSHPQRSSNCTTSKARKTLAYVVVVLVVGGGDGGGVFTGVFFSSRRRLTAAMWAT